MKNLAIFSPSRNAYSETFIQAHKNLDFNIKFYYGGRLPASLEGKKDILDISFRNRIRRKFLKNFTFSEKRLFFSLQKEKIDCILAEYGHSACESLEVIKKSKIPLVVHFHGYDSCDNTQISMYREKYTEVFEYASSVVVVSKKMYQDVLNLGCPQHKLLINYYGPNDDYLNIFPKFNHQQFVSVGRFVKKKAPHLTLLAFAKVVQNFPDAILVMIGEGELLSICKEIAAALGIEKNIQFAGVLSPEKVMDVFKESIAFVQHSIVTDTNDSEGTPVAVLEAQAAGLPVISTFHAGIPDVVIHNETGLLVNEHDVNGMAENMIKILSENGLPKKMGDSGKKRIEQNFTMQRHLNSLSAIINKSMSSM